MANVPTVTLNETIPAGTGNINAGDNRIREFKTQVREMMGVDHDYPSSGQAADNGQHLQVTLQEQADLGTGAVGATIVGSQTVSGVGELVYTTEVDADLQLTSGTTMGSATTDLACGALQFNTSIMDENDNLGGIVPVGGIILWSGAISAIPTGWGICDGTLGTPDLSDSFVIHADNDSGGTRDVGDTGGSHTTTLTTTELPAHTHTVPYTSAGAGGTDISANQSGGAAQNETTSSTGTGSAFNTLPAFYALAYIQKL